MRAHAHRGRAPGALARLAALILSGFALVAALPAAAETTPLASVEAVRSDWHAIVPPADGWTRVSIPDVWTSRWPEHDGVVWYRLTWHQRDAREPTALLLEYLNMAGELRLNGSALWRDASLVEPLTRSWNTPRFFILAPPLLRDGTNTLLVRVAGLHQYEPGIGPVHVGPQSTLRAAYERARFVRRDVKVFSIAVSFTFGMFFVLLWAFHRREVAFGWYGLETLFWIVVAMNQVVTSPWPLPDTHAFRIVNASAFLLWGTSFTMFVLRFCGRRWPRFERALWTTTLLVAAPVLFAEPAWIAVALGVAMLYGSLLGLFATALLIVLAWRGRDAGPRILSLAALTYLAAGTHDLLLLFGLVGGNYFYSDTVAVVTTVATAAVLGWRYARNQRRIENFNVELSQEVELARRELATHLAQQHALEVSHARVGERLNLVRDLHDGLGGTLTGSIAAIENAPQSLSAPRLLGVLKEVRDDLRLIIDASAHVGEGASRLGEQLAPLRHRMSRLLDAGGIACHWSLEDAADVALGASQTLDVLRFLQEALTNVLKHSGASEARITVARAGRGLRIEVVDNGRGFVAQPRRGAGFDSMRARARRLGGELGCESRAGETRVFVDAPLAVG